MHSDIHLLSLIHDHFPHWSHPLSLTDHIPHWALAAKLKQLTLTSNQTVLLMTDNEDDHVENDENNDD